MFLEHGAEKDKIFKNFGVEKPKQVYDFSTNTSIFGDGEAANNYLCKLLTKEGAGLLRDYPDSDSSRCCQYYAEKFQLEENQVMMLNGSNQGVYLIASFTTEQRVGIVAPTYPEYETALIAYGAEIFHYNGIEGLEAAIKRGDLDAGFICNPNNPTGEYIDEEVLYRVAMLASKMDVTLVVDEAYIDFLGQDIKKGSGEGLLIEGIRNGQLDQLILMRSLTKIYQMAGLRIGYLLGSAMQLEALKSRQPSWSVNSLAQAMLMYYEKQAIEPAQVYYQKESRRVIDTIRGYGFDVKETVVNYFLIQVDDDTSIIRFLLEKGIIVRHTRNHVGLDGRYIRVAVLEKETNDYLMDCLRDYAKKAMKREVIEAGH